MKISIICGSHQEHSQSAKVANYLAAQLDTLKLIEESWILDLGSNPLPMWNASIWSGNSEGKERLQLIGEQLSLSDAFIVIAPEYHGMVPAALKNFFLIWDKGELAHKPAIIVSVSAGVGGSYPIAELRMSSYKNNRISYLPEHLIVRNVESVLNDETGDEADQQIRNRAEYSLRLLKEYANAYQQIRNSNVIDLKNWRNGM